MPRDLTDYSIGDWLRLRPFLHRSKEHRYAKIDRQYFDLPAGVGDTERIVNGFRARPQPTHLVTTIAFNDVQTITWQLSLTRHYLYESTLLVCDNSSDASAAEKIQRVCSELGVEYLRLPANPWTGKNPSRSHGIAMNWTWKNVIRPSSPKTFGFLDHDLYPLGSATPHREIGELPCFGDKRWAGDRWFLWAGYCFFDFASVASLPLDFGLDWFLGLDTGGANWDVLYRRLDPKSFSQRPLIEVAALPDVPLKKAYYETRGDDWIHEVGVAGDPELRPRKRAVIERLLKPHLDEAKEAVKRLVA